MEQDKAQWDWLKENWFRVAVVLVLVIGLGTFLNYLSTQNRLDREAFDSKQLEASLDRARQERLDQQKHEESRRAECLKIFQTEDDKWNNVRGHEYVPEDDICYVSYESKKGEWDSVNCEEIGKDWNYDLFGIDSPLTRDMWRRQANCQNNEFEKQF